MEEEFKRRVYTLIGAIPAGHVATYGQIAKLAGAPRHARAVGFLLKNLPKESTLPWYRVINGQGKISFPEDSEKFVEQQERLLAEGVKMCSGKVSLRTFQWQ
ncbi:MGMT family protein [Pseudoalteromonas sp. SMS1]|uniref:MGMT family protein n=1 Tax=Pseudoalteromonas sp. SMS1 TaxID=2908894 RepID=UPI001F1A8573|nr:MGMT family protein [Pseudoalteromonas sp. SMS1]MCF2856015.1 MGMT family protein [Pseudoalteromonas sp. SMS1]